MSSSPTNSLRSIYYQLKQVVKTWPVDPLRAHQPELQISNSISSAVDRIYLSLSNRNVQDQNQSYLKSSEESCPKEKVEIFNKFLHNLEILSSNKLAQKYPFPESMKKPASFPNHYQELNEGVGRAIRGESLPWYKRWIRFT
ncbi:hypothetical protein O181_015314 [Austropuccinia psidii MF-1]|uniref:Ubiquinol-cytochrome-c reductase complex assembly factor 2 n=1 Tax=Austropuccinia psidii MF-1 TaxID=1389203 RepID=A0A9Q3GQQ8_9BASI|nr:hypothetical protein [Austropuccinia psidii MF-1]